MSILNISCIFSIHASILFPRFGDHLYYHCSELFFQVNYLFPLNFSGLIGFYLAPSSATYSSVVSFLSNLLCLWSSFHRLQGYSSSSGVCPWWVRLVQGCVNSWWKRLGPALWWVELRFVPLVGRAIFQGMCFVESVSLV